MTTELTREQRDEIKAAMQEVVERLTDLWDAERRLELAIGHAVDDLGEYFREYAVADAQVDDEDVDSFLAVVESGRTLI